MNLELEPHEQLDEIDLRTNDDGTVQVKILEWEKQKNSGRAVVTFRTPTGEEVGEIMEWPEANDPSFKFIRFINATPYTLRTAEDINEDADLWLDAIISGSNWKLDLPEPQSLVTRLVDMTPEKNTGWGLVKVALWPLTIIAAFGLLLDHDVSYVPLHGDEFSNSPFDSQEELKGAQDAIIYTVITVTWLLVATIILV